MNEKKSRVGRNPSIPKTNKQMNITIDSWIVLKLEFTTRVNSRLEICGVRSPIRLNNHVYSSAKRHPGFIMTYIKNFNLRFPLKSVRVTLISASVIPRANLEMYPGLAGKLSVLGLKIDWKLKFIVSPSRRFVQNISRLLELIAESLVMLYICMYFTRWK